MISSFLALVMAVSMMVVPASAVSPGTVIEGIGAVGTLWDISMAAYELWQEQNPDADPSEYPGFNPGGSFSGAGGSRDDVLAKYEEYVNSLTLSRIDDEGYLYYKIPFSYGQLSVSGEQSYIFKGKQYYFGNTTNESNITDWYSAEVSSMYDPTVVSFRDGGAPCAYMLTLSINSGDFAFPIDGWYCFPAGLNTNFSVVMNNGTVMSGVNSYGYEEEEYYSAGYVRRFNLSSGTYQPDNKTTILSGTVSAPAHYLKVKPLDGLIDVMNDTAYGINSRPASIVGDFGIMGDDGTIVKVESGSLVNESDNLVYSPTTAGEITYTDCVFDYADRSYTLTLEDGSTMKVVYGDEYATIHEGDTIYNVYYLGSESESGGSGGGSGGGSVGDAVSGLLGGLGNILAGLIEGLLKMAADVVESLGGLIDIFNGLIDMIKGFFGGFTGFLGALFPFLPEETFVILNFGLVLLIASAVIKKLFL